MQARDSKIKRVHCRIKQKKQIYRMVQKFIRSMETGIKMTYRIDPTLSKSERLKRFYKDLFIEGPREGIKELPKILPKHHITMHRLKSGKVIVHIPKAWREEWKLWSGPMKMAWTQKGIEPKFLKKWPMTRRETLESAGLVTGMVLPIIAMGTTPLSKTSPAPLMYGTALMGKIAGDKLEDVIEFTERHASRLEKQLKRREKKLVRRLETGLKKISPVEVT